MTTADFWMGVERTLFGWTREEAHAAKKCISCRNDIDPDHMSEADKREYELSGFCPECFDNITNPEDE